MQLGALVRARQRRPAGFRLPPDGRRRGPGIGGHDREAVLLRGRRLDESKGGAGLGLAIVRDLAELYRGSLELTRSSLGDLCATLDLPAAAPTAGSDQAIDVPLPVGR